MSDLFHLRHWLRLSLIDGLGDKSWQKLLQHFESPGGVCQASIGEIKQVLTHTAHAEKIALAIKNADLEKPIEDALGWQQEKNCSLLTLDNPRYPSQLIEIDSPPPLLYCHGDITLLQSPLIAMVGSRNASSAGVHNTKIFAKALSDNQITVVSGLAQGIDAASHRGALLGAGSTVAVIGTGIDKRYPSTNLRLYQEIIEKGLLISEFPIGSKPLPHHFPRRNRIISGLSLGCLVVEATLKSGSLSTATYAAEQGREVFAVPGSINSPLHRGCHKLIRQGATLTENINDILTTLNLPQHTAPQEIYSEDQIEESIAVEGRLLTFINFEPTSIEDIATSTGIAINILLPEILELEINGKIMAVGGGRYQRI